MVIIAKKIRQSEKIAKKKNQKNCLFSFFYFFIFSCQEANAILLDFQY